MLILALDSDAIIKLNRAGLLPSVVRNYRCIISREVYDEVVTTGRARGHPDAEQIHATIGEISHSAPILRKVDVHPSLGRGESSILRILDEPWLSSTVSTPEIENPEVLPVSDDRRFLTYLQSTGRTGVTPVALIVNMCEDGFLTIEHALGSLDRIRGIIPLNEYEEGRMFLEGAGQ